MLENPTSRSGRLFAAPITEHLGAFSGLNQNGQMERWRRMAPAERWALVAEVDNKDLAELLGQAASELEAAEVVERARVSARKGRPCGCATDQTPAVTTKKNDKQRAAGSGGTAPFMVARGAGRGRTGQDGAGRELLEPSFSTAPRLIPETPGYLTGLARRLLSEGA
jgi:hypothetical protein